MTKRKRHWWPIAKCPSQEEGERLRGGVRTGLLMLNQTILEWRRRFRDSIGCKLVELISIYGMELFNKKINWSHSTLSSMQNYEAGSMDLVGNT